MPATVTGRGAQVIVDPGSLTAKAIRGSYASTMEGNLAKVRSDRLLGTFASGDNTADGTTLTGGRATDGAVVPGGTGLPLLLNQPVAPVGNAANTTVNTLQSFTIPAGTLARVGDRLHVTAGGTFTGSTDNKFAVVRLGPLGTAYVQTNTGASSTVTAWRLELYVVKTGANAQATIGMGIGHGSAAQVISSLPALDDTVDMALTVTGQNATNTVANSIVCNFLSVEYMPSTS